MADVRAGVNGGREAPAAAAGAGGGDKKGGGRKPPRKHGSRVKKLPKTCFRCRQPGHIAKDCPMYLGHRMAFDMVADRATRHYQAQLDQAERQRRHEREARRVQDRLQNMQLGRPAENGAQQEQRQQEQPQQQQGPQQPQGQLGAPEPLNWADVMEAEDERNGQN